MHGTFVALFLNARKLGSNFWLGEWDRLNPPTLTNSGFNYRTILSPFTPDDSPP